MVAKHCRCFVYNMTMAAQLSYSILLELLMEV